MTTNQHADAVTVPDNQLDAVAGGVDIGPIGYDFRSSRVNQPPAGRLSLLPWPSLTPRPWRPVAPPSVRVGKRGSGLESAPRTVPALIPRVPLASGI